MTKSLQPTPVRIQRTRTKGWKMPDNTVYVGRGSSFGNPFKATECRAARGWLDWSQDDLADAALVSLSTVRDFERGRRTPIPNNLEAIRRALEAKGIAFRNQPNGAAIGIEWTDSPKSA